MLDRLLQRFRVFVESGHYAISLHAWEEIWNDGLTDLDVESCVLTGAIVERQKDWSTGEWKYVIEGWTLATGSFHTSDRPLPLPRYAA